MGEVAAIGSLMSGAASLGGLLTSNNSAAETQAQLAQNAQTNAMNQQRYQQALNAEALRRSTSGMVDANGNRIYYDPSTNQWVTDLSERGKTIQNAADNANVQRNTTEFQQQLRANSGAERRGIAAESAANPILEQIKRLQSTDPRAIEGDLQQATTLAQRESFRPVIDSTLRQFARTGTAAGPVLAELGAKSYNSLRQAMLENVIRSKMGSSEIDNSRRGGLVNDFVKINSQATPGFNYSPIAGEGPANALASAINARANSGAQTAVYAGMGIPGSTNAFTAATKLGIDAVPNSNLLSAQLQGLGKILGGNNLDPMVAAIGKLFGTSGGGNAGDSAQQNYDNWTSPATSGAWSSANNNLWQW